MKRQIRCGNVYIGGDAPVSIQSMLNVDTRDVRKCIEQIHQLKDAGCDIFRLAIPDTEAAQAFGQIRKETKEPLVADIHFDYRLAIEAIKLGANKVRINPGNIGDISRISAVVKVAKEYEIPIRIGVNSGSIEKSILAKHGAITSEALVESGINNIKTLEDLDFSDIVISIKSSDVAVNYKAYMEIAKRVDYPLHIGVTEAGTLENGKIKSAVGLGALLLSGVGDTMRVSLTGDPVEEILVARKILSSVGMRKEMFNIVSCPTCGRTKVDLEQIAQNVEKQLLQLENESVIKIKSGIKVAIMGCEVNGPGEAADADIGVACGSGLGIIFAEGKVLKKVSEEQIADCLLELIRQKFFTDK